MVAEGSEPSEPLPPRTFPLQSLMLPLNPIQPANPPPHICPLLLTVPLCRHVGSPYPALDSHLHPFPRGSHSGLGLAVTSRTPLLSAPPVPGRPLSITTTSLIQTQPPGPHRSHGRVEISPFLALSQRLAKKHRAICRYFHDLHERGV